MKFIQAWCQFDPLEEVWLADCYPEEFYKNYQDPVKSVFCQITEKTKQDLSEIEQILKSLGVTVCRPKFSADFENYCDHAGRLLKPPMAPRDDNMVLGNTLYHLRNMFNVDPWQSHLERYKNNGEHVIEANFLEKFGYIVPPSIVRLGQDLLVDTSSHEHSWHLMEKDVIPYWSDDFDVRVFNSDGHSDAVFALVGQKKILSSHWKEDYSEFPGWDIHRIKKKPSSWDVHCFRQRTQENNNTLNKSWFVDGLEGNYAAFSEHIEQFASNWIGFANETVFEVNSLMVNESLIITTGIPDQETQQWLKKHKVDFIPANVRTRGFWDSGVHCLTVDIRRRGSKRKIL
jgi:hypothetical protein